ncbi:MAG TPA: VOC family protein [Dehalococcoidia bacterium]
MVDDKELAPLAVELFVPDVAAATRFYAETLGFTVMRAEPPDEPVFAIAHLGEAVLMFMLDRFYTGTRSDLDSRGAGVDIRLMVPDADAVHERIRAAGLEVMHPIGDRDYGLRDFIMRDPFGFRLRFASPLT